MRLRRRLYSGIINLTQICTALLNIYRQWKANGYNDGWATRHFLQGKTLRKAREVRAQLQDIMKSQKVALNSVGTDEDTVR